MLAAWELPPVGGDTLFANQYLAWEMLSDGMKALLRPLRAGQQLGQGLGPDHPQPRRRRRTGRG